MTGTSPGEMMGAVHDGSPTPRWSRYVAIGDSFTEGLWDGPEDDSAPQRGWADQLASHLSTRRVAAGLPQLEYANLAVRGRLMRPILDQQLPAALELAPDLVSLVGGGNDIMRPAVDVDTVAADLDAAVARIRATGADVLLSSGFDTAQSPVVRMTRGRTGVFTAHVWSIARRHGAHVVDVWGMRSLRDWRMWAPDRIHLTPDGHARVAQAALVGLGLAPDRADWDDPLAPLPPAPALDQARANARWVREHAVPWMSRRLRGVSSGDLRDAKRPVPAPVEPA